MKVLSGTDRSMGFPAAARLQMAVGAAVWVSVGGMFGVLDGVELARPGSEVPGVEVASPAEVSGADWVSGDPAVWYTWVAPVNFTASDTESGRLHPAKAARSRIKHGTVSFLRKIIAGIKEDRP
jgi:hypothetical protein